MSTQGYLALEAVGFEAHVAVEVVSLGHVDLFAPGCEAESHNIGAFADEGIEGKSQYFVPEGWLEQRLEVVNHDFHHAVRALQREHAHVSQAAVHEIEHALPAELVAAAVQPVRVVWLLAAYPAHVGVDHLLLGDCQ